MTLKVLALCGFTQNAHIYSKQLGAIRKTCKDVEFVFLEPPIVIEKCDLPWASSLNEFDSTATTEKEQQTPETTPRGWWLSDSESKVYRRFDESVAYVHDAMVKQGPFDGVMGFSQGACMAAIVAALTEKPNLSPSWPAEPPIPKLKFVIAVGGFLPQPQSPSFEGWFPLPASLPVLTIIGKNDTVVSPEKTQSLIDGSLNSRVEYHDGGHFTPSKASWRHFINAYINSFAEGGSHGDIGPPSSFGPSGTNTPATASGANTPSRQTPVPKATTSQP